MKIIPCEQNKELDAQIREYAETLKTEAHTLGNHGLDEDEFYRRGVLRGAIELIRGQYSATLREKRAFVRGVLNLLQDRAYIRDWEPLGDANRHDYSVRLLSGRVAIIEIKGCMDGNNTTIFERPAQADEFIIWSICISPGADPRHNAWSGIHTRLSAEIIARQRQIDGIIIWDMVCGTIGRPCPKLSVAPDRFTEIGPHKLPPPCIYLLPATVPSPETNPRPSAQAIGDVQFLNALHDCFGGRDDELNYVEFEVGRRGGDMVRTTSITRAGQVLHSSKATTIRKS